MSRERVVITGVGTVNAAVTGDFRDLGAFLAVPRLAIGEGDGGPRAAWLRAGVPASLVDEQSARRLSRVSQLTMAAARLALAESGYDARAGLGLVVGSELGDLRSTIEFVDGFLQRGPAGLSALLFPNTVMNTMAASTAIAVGARELSLTLNAPGVAGELAVARATAAVAAGRAEAVLAGGVDELALPVAQALAELAGDDLRGEGATFLVLESLASARRRGATVRGEICGAAWRALRAQPHGIGRGLESRAVPAALAHAGLPADAIGWVYDSASGDTARDAWVEAVVARALGRRVPETSLHGLLGHHSGLGTLRVAAAAWTASSRRLPRAPDSAAGGDWSGAAAALPVDGRAGLVHALARGGAEVALVVTGAESPA
jgi:3-oxoacyl-[acyl-carrier-protein] synthase II